MLFSSLVFLFFFLPAVLAVYYLFCRTRKLKNICLTIFSLFFYAWGEPKFVLVMLFSIIANYAFGLLADFSHKKKNILIGRLSIILTAVFNLSLLGFFKYLDFTINNLNFVFGTQISLQNIALPIGISFFTFQAMSYVFDVYLKRGSVQKNPLNIVLYISFFPQLIAGPIVRYETISKQIMDRKENLALFSSGITRFIEGLAKKVLLANPLAIIADKAFGFNNYTELPASFAILGILAYTLQIFYDFSGYSDMAIGLGQMFGFQFFENFNYPYMANSVSEFWRRWHISLGSWFRDYIYFPLGGSRVENKFRLVLNLFIVWLLTGIWHGASWNFVAWGLMYFILIAFEKLSGLPHKLKKSLSKIIYRLLTLFTIILGWVLFRTTGLSRAVSYILSVFAANGNVLHGKITLLYFKEFFFVLIPAIIFATPIIPYFKNNLIPKLQKKNILKAIIFRTCYQVVLILIFFIVISYLVRGSYNPFIYFNF